MGASIDRPDVRLFPCLVSGLLIIAAVVGAGWLLLTWMFPVDSTNPRDYPKLLRQWQPLLVAHFPQQVPPHAQGVRFSGHPGALQGGPHLQLRMQLPAEEMRELDERLRELAGQGAGSDAFPTAADRAAPDEFLTVLRFRTGDSTSIDPFPDHYRVYVLAARAGTRSRAAGAAISIEANEVVYWAEAW